MKIDKIIISSQQMNDMIVRFNNNKNNIIKYILFYNNIEYTSEFISKVIYDKFVNSTPIEYDYEQEYVKTISRCSELSLIYNFNNDDKYIKQFIEYYDIHNTNFSNYLRSINCLLSIIRTYRDLRDDATFDNYNIVKLKKLMTPKLIEVYNEKTDNYKNENTRLYELAHIIKHMTEFKYIYEQICSTSSWDFVDFSRIITYIDKYDLDVFTTLKILAEDHNYAFYKVKPKQTGIQNVSVMTLVDLKYTFTYYKDRTEQTQKIIDEIYNIECSDYLKDYNNAVHIILKLFKRTVEKHLIWGIKIM